MWWDLKFLLNWSTMKLKMLKPRCISVYKYLLNAFISMLNTGWQPFLLSILFFIPILGDNCISLWFQSVFSQQDTFKSNLKFFPTIHFIWAESVPSISCWSSAVDAESECAVMRRWQPLCLAKDGIFSLATPHFLSGRGPESNPPQNPSIGSTPEPHDSWGQGQQS